MVEEEGWAGGERGVQCRRGEENSGKQGVGAAVDLFLFLCLKMPVCIMIIITIHHPICSVSGCQIACRFKCLGEQWSLLIDKWASCDRKWVSSDKTMGRSMAELVFYTWVARSHSGSSSFTASALNFLLLLLFLLLYAWYVSFDGLEWIVLDSIG